MVCNKKRKLVFIKWKWNHVIFSSPTILSFHPVISARRPDLVIVNNEKKKKRIVDLAIPADHRVKLKESEKRDKYLDLAIELKKTMEHEGDSDTNCNWCTWNNPQRIDKGAKRFRNQRTSRDHPDYSIIKIDQNTE